MPEQLRLFPTQTIRGQAKSTISPDALDNLEIQTPIDSPARNHLTPAAQIVRGEGETPDVIIYNISTDFKGTDKEHKTSFVRRPKTESAYVDVVPDLDKLPRPGAPELDREERERIIRDSTVPEVAPFMAGARIALAERRAKKNHAKAQSALRQAPTHRRSLVANHVAMSVLNDTDHSNPEDKLRPKTLPEKAMARRMGRLITRANAHNHYANILEDMYTPEGEVRPVKPDDFYKDWENLSIFERRQRSYAHHLYKTRREHSNRLIHGHRVPRTDKRIGLLSFESLAAGGPGSPINKARKALRKRDKAVLKAEALKRRTRTRRAR